MQTDYTPWDARADGMYIYINYTYYVVMTHNMSETYQNPLQFWNQIWKINESVK